MDFDFDALNLDDPRAQRRARWNVNRNRAMFPDPVGGPAVLDPLPAQPQAFYRPMHDNHRVPSHPLFQGKLVKILEVGCTSLSCLQRQRTGTSRPK